MRYGRNFGSTTSGNSILLGFLDVISCGFAAALVLGLIFSLVQPSAAGGGSPRQDFQYHEYVIVDNVPNAPGRPYLIPDITYRRGAGPIERVPIRLVGGKWDVGSTDFKIQFYGADPMDERPVQPADGANARQTMIGILLNDLPKGISIRVRLVYAGRADLPSFLPSKDQELSVTMNHRILGLAEQLKPATDSNLPIGGFSQAGEKGEGFLP